VGWVLTQRNRIYALACMRDAVLARGEAPYASHVMFSEALDDARPEERAAGMESGFLWGVFAEARVVYCDYGISPGMAQGIAQRPPGQLVEYRYLNPYRARVHRCQRCGLSVPPTNRTCAGVACLVN